MERSDATAAETPTTGPDVGGEQAAEISRGGVHILREYTGRGPTRAKTVINHNVVTILLEDTLTKGERKLVELGHAERVLETRREYQRAMQDELVTLVETALGREVLAFLSDNHLDPDVAVEVFILADATNGAPRPSSG